MPIPERPVMAARDELQRRLERLAKVPEGGADVPMPDEVAQAAQRLAAGAADLEAFLDRWEQRFGSLEKASLNTTAAFLGRIEDSAEQLMAQVRALAVARLWREVMIFVCGVVFGGSLAFGGLYYWRSQDLAQDTHDVLAKILENTNERRAAEAAAAAKAASPKPARPR
jgi:hypothetical protein